MTWPPQETDSPLDQLAQTAIAQGPQTITLRGKAAAVVVSAEDYRRLTQPPQRMASIRDLKVALQAPEQPVSIDEMDNTIRKRASDQ